MRVLVVGGGIFGLTAALALRERGCTVTLVDAAAIPAPDAESTDISKVVRIDYGSDVDYTVLGERAIEGWRRMPAGLDHETGVAYLARSPMQPGGFEHDTYALLTARGHELERLDSAAITRRFPAYAPGAFVDGYTHATGGWVAAAAVVRHFAERARAAGVIIREHCRITRIVDDGALAETEHLAADAIAICSGAWAMQLHPALAGSLHAVGQPVFHLQPDDPSLFAAERFPVFGADVARTGYYGFPINAGVVKIANHGTGLAMAPDAPRAVTPDQEARLRAFLHDTFPALGDAPIVHRRLCVYGDTLDGHFWIARDPQRANLTVATGGSGHAFKFAPELGALIADTVLGIAHPLAHKFRWRPELVELTRGDAARAD